MNRLGELLGHHVRESIALDPAARPEWGAGLRAATAMAIPLIAGWHLKRPELLWAGLGGWLTMLADPGGTYRVRAAAMMTLALAGSAATLLGGLAGLSPWIGSGLLFAFALLCSLMRVRGDTAGTLGVLTLIEFCLTYGNPAHLHPGLLRAALFAAGALFALLFAIALWPFRPYRPVRAAISAAYAGLADAADEAAQLTASPFETAGWQTLDSIRRRVREMLERSRQALGVARAAHHGETGRGLQLLVLYEIAELLLGDLEAFVEALRSRSEKHRPLPIHAAESLARLAADQRAVANAIRADPQGAGPGLDLQTEEFRIALPDPEARTDLLPLARRVEDEMRHARQAVVALNGGGPGPQRPGTAAPPDEPPSLRDVLSLSSAEVRHAVRLALVATAAQLLANTLRLQRSYWVTLTSVLVLQPHAVATVRRALQRVGGTVIGGIVAALIARYAHRSPVALPLLFLMASTGVALRRVNYAVFAALITPVFVLLAEVNAGTTHLTEVRILDTLLGGALALFGALTLWPTRELPRMPALIAATLRANASYLEAILEGQPPSVVVPARRRIGLVTANVEAALQRLLGEKPPPDRVQPLMTLVAYSRRLSASSTAIGAEHAEVRGRLAGFVDILRALANAADAGRRPLPLPEIALAKEPEPVQRLARQLRVVRSALARVV